MNDLRFRTFHVLEDELEIGRVTAVTVPTNEEKTEFMTQFSFCNPNDMADREYNRNKGKFIAVQRLTGRTAIKFARKNTPIAETLKSLIVNEAKRKNIKWWVNPSVDDLK